jgi:hypothetical protein
MEIVVHPLPSSDLHLTELSISENGGGVYATGS